MCYDLGTRPQTKPMFAGVTEGPRQNNRPWNPVAPSSQPRNAAPNNDPNVIGYKHLRGRYRCAQTPVPLSPPSETPPHRNTALILECTGAQGCACDVDAESSGWGGGGGADVDLRVASVDEKRRQPSPLDGGRCVQPLQGAPWGSSRRGPQGTLRRQCISLTAAGPCGLRSPSARRIKWERVHGVRTPRTVLDSYTAFTPETGSQKGTGQHFLMGSGYFPMGPGWTATQHVTGHQQSRTMASGQLSKKTKRRTVRARYAPLPPDLFPTQPKRIRICCTPNGPPCGASSRRRWGVWGWWVNGM